MNPERNRQLSIFIISLTFHLSLSPNSTLNIVTTFAFGVFPVTCKTTFEDVHFYFINTIFAFSFFISLHSCSSLLSPSSFCFLSSLNWLFKVYIKITFYLLYPNRLPCLMKQSSFAFSEFAFSGKSIFSLSLPPPPSSY